MSITEENGALELAKRNPQALEFAIDTYGKSVYALAERVLSGCGNRQDTEECVSDAFVAAWERARQFDPGEGTFILIKGPWQIDLGSRPAANAN